MPFEFVVYKITFPNGKIYVGSDTQHNGHNINYFGSWSNCLVEKDFTKEELSDFVICKSILFESNNAEEVKRKEVRFIRELHSNDLSVGYNQTHRSKLQR